MPSPIKPNFDFDGLIFLDLSVSVIVATSNSSWTGSSKISVGRLMTARAAFDDVRATTTGEDAISFLISSCMLSSLLLLWFELEATGVIDSFLTRFVGTGVSSGSSLYDALVFLGCCRYLDEEIAGFF